MTDNIVRDGVGSVASTTAEVQLRAIMPSPDPKQSAALAARYRLERELGAGGSATVYLADDVKHKRQVAVKVLHRELAAAVGHERFLREITTTANLRHPNILPLFDSGEEDGFLFYVMPFVEGGSLRDRITREGQLPMEDVLSIADEVADALAYAHQSGVVHRDIKPENILLENGHAVVADFGIAYAATNAGDVRLTSLGGAIGTPYYMSPEQANGEPGDARSDLYALACVTYEMLTGDPPFTGRSAVAVMARHAMDPVPSIETVRPQAAGRLATAIERSLAKVPADRYPTLDEWREAIVVPVGSGSGDASPQAGIHKPPPAPATPLLGRERHIEEAVERMEEGARVLTVTGYGGTGKTRFSIELFRRLESHFAGGAAFVSLASVTDSGEVMPTVGISLDIAEAHGRSALDALCTVIGENHVLLVLDNLEQVLDAAGDIAALVARCPALQVIATSRAPLKIGAEHEFVLPPLDLPSMEATALGELLACPSVALFVQRARKVQAGFELSEANAAAVTEICRRLDGLPLALELAAARVRILEPAALLQRLDHALDLLTSGDRDLPLRQRTLRTTISWSYSLLEPGEQRLLRGLSVFHEGWTFDAVEQVCYDEGERYQALDELDSLVEKGLVRVVDVGKRYSLLETIRAFAAEQLHAAGEVEDARQAHARYLVKFARKVSADIRGQGQLEAMARARAENANAMAAASWLAVRAQTGDEDAVENGLLLCGGLCWPWHIHGLHLTGAALVDIFLPLASEAPPTLGRAMAGCTTSIMRASTGDLEGALEAANQAYDDGVALDDNAVTAEASLHRGYDNMLLGRPEKALDSIDECRDRALSAGDEFLAGIAMAIKGMLLFLGGDLESGLALVRAARDMQIRIGDFEGRGLALSFLAQMTFAQGDHTGAVETFREALASFQAVGDRPEIARLHCEMGWAALGAGDPVEAQRAFAAAVRTYEEVGSAPGTGQALMGLAAVEAAQGRSERAVAIAASAQELSARAGVVVDHPMDPGVAARIGALKATIPEATLMGLEADARDLTPGAVLDMLGT
jgi:predicted ATPase/tRNA A-37 threonylcarbamoyl transferase component Bud32